MLKSIYACKMYRYSKHKDKIHSAISNPLNAELVQQLSKYVDFNEPKELPESYVDTTKVNNKEDTSTTQKSESKPLSFTPHSSITSKPSSEQLDTTAESEEPEDAKVTDTANTGKDDTTEEKSSETSNVEESTKIKGNQVVESGTVLYNNSCICVDKLPEVVDQIKGALNLRADTKGVNRVLVKDSELWIYYDDSINLNNVMAAVIEFLNAANYQYLEFNRLARSDNAIVFEVSLEDTNKSVDPVGENSDGKK